MPVCSNCGEENPDRARFCLTCGTPLMEAPRAERRERRVVSVLFADLAGFTSRSESLDVEDVEGFLAPYLAVLQSEVERTGGEVVKFTGDGVMAIFGAATAHEDDPERAVRSALGICERVTEAGDSDSQVRVGVTSGEALVSHDPAGGVDAVGDVVNTAARLESAAPLGGVLVDEWTYRATDRAIRYDPAEAVDAKGKSEPVEAWVAVGARSIVPEQARVGGLPLVGRDAEADVLRGALDRARGEPSTQLVSVIGEPGIGKTRLVEELLGHVEEIPELITWRRGRSLSYGEGVAFWALGEMVKAQAGILESDAADMAVAKLGEAVEMVILDQRDRAWVSRHLRPLVGVESTDSSGEHGQLEAFAAWRRFFEALAEDGPTVLVFEDIHWADDALLDFIDLLADRAGAVPLLLVCTARPELLERRPSWGGGKPNASTLSLTPLSDEDTARLVAALLDQGLLPAEVQQALLERSEGNPLYAQEYVRMLQDRGLLVRSDGGWVLTGQAEGLPESIQGIIAARLDTLSPAEKLFIHDAAVIGRTAWTSAVCHLTSRSVWEADETLHRLERRQLLERVRRSSIEGQTEFAFAHALTRDVAYQQIRRKDRALKHEIAAQWIDQLASIRDDKAELLADHYRNAIELRRQLGDDTTHLEPRARTVYTDAAKQARALYNYAAAVQHYRAALELTPESDLPARAQLMLGEARSLTFLNTADLTLLEATIRAQVAAEDWAGAALAEDIASAWYDRNTSDGELADYHSEQAAGHLRRAPVTDETCHVAGNRCLWLMLRGEAAESLELATRMLSAAQDEGLEIGVASLLAARGIARVVLGDVDGIDDQRQASETADRLNDPLAMSGYGNLAEALRGFGRMGEADEAYRMGERAVRRFGSPTHLMWILSEQAVQAYHHADWETADRLLARIDISSPLDEISVAFTRGRLNAARGQPDAALVDATTTVSFARSHSNIEYLCGALALEAFAWHWNREPAESLSACHGFLEAWSSVQDSSARALELCEVGSILASTDAHAQLNEAASRLPETCRWREPLMLIAVQHYADAATLYAQIGSQSLAADAHLLAAAQARRQGRVADAHRHAEAVVEFAKRTGATAYQRRAEELLAATA
jgi:class 3 adenylate cyclase/tetratricopeptide (TPR) repeat protein